MRTRELTWSAPPMEILLICSALTFSLPVYYKPVAAFIAAISLLIVGGALSFRSPLASMLFLPLLAGVIFSAVFGCAPGPGSEYSWMLLSGAAFFSLAGANRQAPRPGILMAIAGAGLALASLASWFARSSPPYLWLHSPIDLGMAILLLGLFGSRAVKKGGARDGYLALIFVATAAGSSRALIAAALVSIWFLLSSRAAKFAVILLFAAAIPQVLLRLEGDPLAWNRIRIYIAAINLILERPWTGWGLGSFDAVSRRAGLPDPLPIHHMINPVYAHSEPLEIAFEIGLVLAAALAVAYIILLINLKKRSLPDFALLLAIGIVSLFYFPLRLSFPLFMAFAAAGAAVPHESQLRGRSRNVARIICIVLSVPFFLYSYGLFTRNPTMATYDARLAMNVQGNSDAVMKMAELEPEKPETHRNLGQFSLNSGSPAAAIRHYSAAVERAPNEVSHRLALARAAIAFSQTAVVSSERSKWINHASRHLLYAGAVEPLFLVPYVIKGDTMGFNIANAALDRAARSAVPASHIRQMRERL